MSYKLVTPILIFLLSIYLLSVIPTYNAWVVLVVLFMVGLVAMAAVLNYMR